MARWFILILFAATCSLRADKVADPLANQGVVEFMAAYQNWDADRFKQAAELFAQAAALDPSSATNLYWLGVAHFHRMLHLRTLNVSSTNSAAANSAMENAISALGRAVKLDPRHAESHALLGTLYGMKIDGNVLRALRFGPQIDRHHKAAVLSGPENPRVRYLLGTCQFHTAKKPTGHREALATFLHAEHLFETEARSRPGPLDPRWGYASCLSFIGRTYEQLGQHAEAAAYFRKALAQHPADHLARDGLARLTKKP